MKHTLDLYAQQDPRILAVYREARRRYGKKGLFHHNFGHVLRDLYRALVIAAEEETVDYRVLIPSVLLHDIGFSDPDFRRRGHDVIGARLAEALLKDLGYEPEEVLAITHCIRAHKGKAERPRTIEAKILYDADVLEKAGLAYLILGGKIICEFEETMETFLDRETGDRATELSAGFYTRKARELDGGRLQRTWSLLRRVRDEIEGTRSDYRITEPDLWANVPQEMGVEAGSGKGPRGRVA